MTGNRSLLVPASAAMELSWRCAWATFLTTSALGQPFPLAEAACSFLVAVAVTAVSTGRGWRVVAVLGLQAAAFLPAARWMAHAFRGGAYALPWSRSEPIGASLAAADWVVLLLAGFWAFAFWGGGVALARRARDYPTVCTRFDLGLSAFLLLLLADFGLTYGGVERSGQSTLAFFPSFLLFGLLAVGVAREPAAEGTSFLPGRRSLGVVLSFVAGILLLALGSISLFLPVLGRAADAGYRGLSAAGRSSLPYLESALLWLHRALGGRSPVERPMKTREPAAAAAEAASRAAPAGWLELVGQVLVWLVGGLLGAVFLLVTGVTLYGFVRWLFSRTGAAEPNPLGRELLAVWRRLPAAGRALLGRLLRRLRRCRTAAHAYEALLGWGRWSGVVRRPAETAREYGLRLNAGFPLVAGEIDAIVEAYHREVYAGVPPGRAELEAARSALRSLRSARLWPARARTRFAGKRQEGGE